MKKFNQFGIKPTEKGLTGTKVKITRIINKEIVVKDFRIEPSKFPKKPDDKCLYLQFDCGGVEQITFTGSISLMEQIQQVKRNDFPFETIIINNNDRFEFS